MKRANSDSLGTFLQISQQLKLPLNAEHVVVQSTIFLPEQCGSFNRPFN